MLYFKQFYSLFITGIILALIHTGCADDQHRVTELSVDDFYFNGLLGSHGAEIARVDTNHFLITLDHAPDNPQWPNKVNFEIRQNAKGNDLTLEVEFEGGPGMSFNEYHQSWSYDGENWQPIHWEKGFRDSPQYDILEFPVFEEDHVHVGTQVPMSFETAEAMKQEWAEHPHATLHTIGESMQGRPLYRLEITDPDSPVAPEQRWGHYFANQHPGEHNSHWRMVGMADWILSDEGDEFRQRNVAHFIFFMSPDAPTHGWYRVNEEGIDMNRSYSPEGSDPDEQTHEAYEFQTDLEELMVSETPITTIWAMHTWQGIVEPLLRVGPEMGTTLGPWEDFAEIMASNDPDELIKPLAVRDSPPGFGPVSWSDGPHHQFGITAILCEGGSTFYTSEKNMESGEILIRSIDEYYNIPKE
ncbi:MAG: hypothetical protein JJU13_04020 [Balneolaceae bacterium]|nr:hypothetical protein [Balneolaceae bacterium]